MPTKPRRKGALGRHSYAPTEKDRYDVRMGVINNFSQIQLCDYLNISPKTLRKHFKRELTTALMEANMAVTGTMFHTATRRDGSAATVNAGKFILERRGGPAWQAKTTVEVSGPNGEAIKTESIVAEVTTEAAADAYQRMIRGSE